jgi:hypothetical protein
VSTQLTIADLQEALENTAGRTPQEIIDAFCPLGTTIAGKPLLPLTAGHDLFLSRIKHPLAVGAKAWTAEDVATALFVFTTPSVELFAMIEDGSYESAFWAFLDTLPMNELEAAAAALLAHWAKSRATAIPMKAPAGVDGSKKKAASAIGSR